MSYFLPHVQGGKSREEESRSGVRSVKCRGECRHLRPCRPQETCTEFWQNRQDEWLAGHGLRQPSGQTITPSGRRNANFAPVKTIRNDGLRIRSSSTRLATFRRFPAASSIRALPSFTSTPPHLPSGNDTTRSTSSPCRSRKCETRPSIVCEYTRRSRQHIDSNRNPSVTMSRIRPSGFAPRTAAGMGRLANQREVIRLVSRPSGREWQAYGFAVGLCEALVEPKRCGPTW